MEENKKIEDKNIEDKSQNQNTEVADAEVKEVLPVKKKQTKRWLWLIPIGLFLLTALCFAWYYKKVVYYEEHFFPNTYINNMDCSNMVAADVAAYLDTHAYVYSIEIWGRDEAGEEAVLGKLSAEEIGYSFIDSLGAVSKILEQQNGWQWITAKGNDRRSFSLLQETHFDSMLLAEKVKGLEAFQKKNMIAPEDAYISEYSEEIGGYEIVPETIGTTFDVEHAIACVEAAVMGNAEKVDLWEQGCYEVPEITSDDKEMRSKVELINQWLSAEITYGWNGNETIVDRGVIKDWASFVEGEPTLDEEAVAEFVNNNADTYDTFGKYTNFTTTLGVELSLPRLSYGWRTDRSGEAEVLIALIKAGEQQHREPIYVRKGVWKGQNDIGTSYIEADLTHQHLYVYQQGVIVFETDFVSGNMNSPGCVSPAGIFGLTYKTMNAVLRGENYETPVTYWMPFYGNFGMHDATWRSSFGGDIFLTNGSHGCLNLPLEAAAQIYNYVYEGSPIICYYY